MVQMNAFQLLTGAAIAFFVFGILNMQSAKTVSSLSSDFVEDTAEYNVSQETKAGTYELAQGGTDIAEFFPALLIIALIVGFFGKKAMGGSGL